MGSEPGIGWNTVCQAAQNHDVWVITRANNRESIESALGVEPIPNIHFVYFDLPRWARFWKRGSRGVHLYFYLWQLWAVSVVRKLAREVPFDVAHHITFGTYSYPSLLAFTGVPYVWGPVGGGESAPLAFWKSLGWKGGLFEFVRSLARMRGERDPLVRRTAQKATIVVATTEETATRIRALGAPKVVTQSVAALNETDLQLLGALPPRTSAPFRIFSVGRQLHWKGFQLGLEAFSRLLHDFPESEYWMIGDGPERERLKRSAKKLGIAHRVTFFGNLDRPETLQKMAECDVLLFPTLHDSGGWASVEAMAAGRPVVCLDLGGPALQVNEETGFRIQAINPVQALNEITEALRCLAKDRTLCNRMGEASRKRVGEKFNWGRVGEKFEAMYQGIASSDRKENAVATAGMAQTIQPHKSSANVTFEREA